MRVRLLPLAMVSFLALTGCAITGVHSHTDLAAALTEKGLKVSPKYERISSPLFEPDGYSVRIGQEEIQTYQLKSSNAASTAADNIAPDGTPKDQLQWDWRGRQPHFYRNGNFIALYLGRNPVITNPLTSIFGPQFAGAPPPTALTLTESGMKANYGASSSGALSSDR